MKQPFLCFLTVVFCFFACRKPIEILPETILSNNGKQILLLNEGNFQWGNASIDALNDINYELDKNKFEKVNKRPLGDICQSAAIINAKLWIVVNNSGKIEIIDTSNFNSIYTIKNLTSPRFALFHNGSVFVSDLYSNKISVFDAETFKLVSTVAVNGWVEELISFNNEVYFLNKKLNVLQKINVQNQVIDVFQFGKALSLQNENSKALYYTIKNDSVFSFDISSLNNQFIYLCKKNSPLKIKHSKNETYLLFSNELIKVNDRNTAQIFTKTDANFYGFNLIDEKIYLSDARDYVSNSEIFILSSSGSLIKSLNGGSITNGFLKLY